MELTTGKESTSLFGAPARFLMGILFPETPPIEYPKVPFVPSPWDEPAAPFTAPPEMKSTVDDRVKLTVPETLTFDFVERGKAEKALRGDGELDGFDWAQLTADGKYKNPNHALCEAVKRGRATNTPLAEIARKQGVSLPTVKLISAALSKAAEFRAKSV